MEEKNVFLIETPKKEERGKGKNRAETMKKIEITTMGHRFNPDNPYYSGVISYVFVYSLVRDLTIKMSLLKLVKRGPVKGTLKNT